MTLEQRIAALEAEVFGARTPAVKIDLDGEGEQGLKVLKAIYPNATLDDQDKIRAEWTGLTSAERLVALNGVAPFIAALFAAGRKLPPSVWCYLRDRRWTMVEPLIAAPALARPLPTFPFTGEAGLAYMLNLLKPGTVLKDHDRAILTDRWQRMSAVDQIKAVQMAALEAGEHGIDRPVILFVATRRGERPAATEDS